MYGETTIPIRDELPDFPTSFRGKRLLGVDAYLFGHYWCGDRVEVYERRDVLRADDRGAALDVDYRERAVIPVDALEGGVGEYVTNVGAYLDQYVETEKPVYADDATEWEWVSAYARDLVGRRGTLRSGSPTTAYGRPAGRHRR